MRLLTLTLTLTLTLALALTLSLILTLSRYIAGTWGVYDAYLRSVSGRASKTDTAPKRAGTHLWIRVDRDKSTATLTGMGGLPVRESFSMWGRPRTPNPYPYPYP